MRKINANFGKLTGKTALIVGCGNLGSKNARLLARWGINLMLVDFDKVSVPNLGTQEYNEADVGKKKADALKKHMQFINSKIKVTAVNEKITAKNAERIMENADIVIDACDNIETRFVINSACKKLVIPWVYGTVEKNNGVVACFGDTYAFDSLVSRKAKTSKVEVVGVTPEIASVIASLQVRNAIEYLSSGRLSGDVAFVNLDTFSMECAENIFF